MPRLLTEQVRQRHRSIPPSPSRIGTAISRSVRRQRFSYPQVITERTAFRGRDRPAHFANDARQNRHQKTDGTLAAPDVSAHSYATVDNGRRCRYCPSRANGSDVPS